MFFKVTDSEDKDKQYYINTQKVVTISKYKGNSDKYTVFEFSDGKERVVVGSLSYFLGILSEDTKVIG